jgi:CHAT domain-containing protein
LSPDGAYHQINPTTLYNPNTKTYLLEEISIQLVPSTSWIVAQKKSNALTNVAIFAHPDYGSASTTKSNLTRSLDLENINDLPGTEKELDDIVLLLKQNKINYTDFEGSSATEDKIKTVSLPQVLHIATHGYFLPTLNEQDKVQNPLLRSGLLMAGCQKKPHLQNPDVNDGVLTAFEVSTLPLYNTSLVVLSACETGLGDVKNGEGVYGLQRAFLMGGAQRVMMSLWKVDDEATREFMVLFYQNWITTKDISNAFQVAQKKLMQKFPHPYYWGAFVISGN